jgi:hypothetical protein
MLLPLRVFPSSRMTLLSLSDDFLATYDAVISLPSSFGPEAAGEQQKLNMGMHGTTDDARAWQESVGNR